jgi:hypothetical protein
MNGWRHRELLRVRCRQTGRLVHVASVTYLGCVCKGYVASLSLSGVSLTAVEYGWIHILCDEGQFLMVVCQRWKDGL